jgi:hypothetical protein
VDEASDVATALESAIQEALRLGFPIIWNDIEKFLEIAELWVDRDILRAKILKDSDPTAGTRYAIALSQPVGR